MNANIEQALAKCMELTRGADRESALKEGRALEGSYRGEPRVLARVARMYSELGLQGEANRVLQGLQSALGYENAPFSGFEEESDDGAEPGQNLYDADDDEVTVARPFEAMAAVVGNAARRASSGPPPPPKRPSSVPPPPPGAAPAVGVPPPPARPSSAPPPPLKSSPSAPPPPPKPSAAPPPPLKASAAPPPPLKPSAAPPPPLKSSAAPPPPGLPPPSVPPPPGRASAPAPARGSGPPAPPGAVSAPPPPLKPSTPAAATKSSMPPSLPPPPSFPPAPGAAVARAPAPDIFVKRQEEEDEEWAFDEDDDEPTRAFSPAMLAAKPKQESAPPRAGQSSAPPAARPAAAAAASTDSEPPPSGMREKLSGLRDASLGLLKRFKKGEKDEKQAEIEAEAMLAKGRARVLLGKLSPKSFRSIVLLVGIVMLVVFIYGRREAVVEQDRLRADLTQAAPLLWSSDIEEVRGLNKYVEHSFAIGGFGAVSNWLVGAIGLPKEYLIESMENDAKLLKLKQHVVLSLTDPKTEHPVKRAKELIEELDESTPKEQLAFVDFVGALDPKPQDVKKATKLDDAAKKDALALVLSGMLLERVGEVGEASKRYEAAADVEENWYLPKLLGVRVTLLSKGPAVAKAGLDSFKEAARVDPNLAGISRGLQALAWVTDPKRTKTPPDTAKLEPDEAKTLPPALANVRALAKLVSKVEEEDGSAKDDLKEAIGNADGPALLVRLAQFGARLNERELVDKALERVQEFAKGYTPAMQLAARMQLRRGDFGAARETAKAAKLSTASVDAVEAYEAQDIDALTKALESMSDEEKENQEYAAVRLAAGVLTGSEYPSDERLDDLMSQNQLWAELIGVDAALDQGKLGRAGKIIKGWAEEDRTALHLVRVARYERFRGRVNDAIPLSRKALDQASTSNRALLEHIYALIAADRVKDAITLYKDALYRDLMKPYDGWVDGLLIGKDKGWMAANYKVSYLVAPRAKHALGLRLLAARAMAVAGDPRAGFYMKGLKKVVEKNPDLITAEEEY